MIALVNELGPLMHTVALRKLYTRLIILKQVDDTAVDIPQLFENPIQPHCFLARCRGRHVLGLHGL